MIELQSSEYEGQNQLLGVWDERWCARARLAGQVERYRVWLRGQGCSRDQAAEMAVRLLMAREPGAPEVFPSSNALLIH